ncbi:hypothetical protein QM294_10690 [Acinetobacter junii]|uniref:hypothetical protein n=1 Tax=Acinetobacter junii TaxID=40215 RepID=UPI00148F001C|nr:hypothetical protein [Acinetobacter junii]MDI9721258.1 hypothetical protein [Acinetobacter junii]
MGGTWLFQDGGRGAAGGLAKRYFLYCQVVIAVGFDVFVKKLSGKSIGYGDNYGVYRIDS